MNPARGIKGATPSSSGWFTFLKRRELLAGCALVVLTLLAFAPVLQCGFVDFDDLDYVKSNSEIQKGLTGEVIVWSFTATAASNWHPLTWLSLALDVDLYGLNPAGFHATNVLLHLGSVLLLYCFLGRSTGRWLPAALTAALFAVHPLRVESVAWIAERKDVLSLFFGLLTLNAYLRYTRRLTGGAYLLVLLAYAASLAAKQMLVTLPCLLLLLDWWPLRRLNGGQSAVGAKPTTPFPPVPLRRLLLEKVPLLALTVGASVITLIVQTNSGAVRSLTVIPLSSRLANAVDATATYLQQTLWPVDLAVYYPYHQAGVPPLRLAAEGLLLLGITAAALRLARTQPYLLVGWLWFLGTLVPVIGLIQVGLQAHADRYTYLPHIGLFLAIVWGLANGLPTRWQRWPGWTAALLVLSLWVLLTRAQVGTWRNSIILWEHDLAVAEPCALVRANYAATLMDAEREHEAVRELKAALKLDPTWSTALYMMGGIHQKYGRYPEALECYRLAVQYAPNDADFRARLNLMGTPYPALTAAVGLGARLAVVEKAVADAATP